MSDVSDADSLIETEPLKTSTNDLVEQPIKTKRPSKLGIKTNESKARRSRGQHKATTPDNYEGYNGSKAIETPDFTMTQSMFEVTDKQRNMEKEKAEKKLFNLLVKEKQAEKAREKVEKEKRARAQEQRRRNEERHQKVEERRQRMKNEEQTRRPRSSVMSPPSAMTNSLFIQSGARYNSANRKSSIDFLSSRPVSSTGKVFGFGSSTPRVACQPIPKYARSQSERPSNSTYRLNQSCGDLVSSKSSRQNVRSMTSSQIVLKSNHTQKRPSKLMMQSVIETTSSTSEKQSIRPRDLKSRTKTNVKPQNSNYSTKTSSLPRKKDMGSSSLINDGTEKEKYKSSNLDEFKNNKPQSRSKSSNHPRTKTNLPTHKKTEEPLQISSTIDESKEIKKEISEDEYREKLRLQRQLAREKRMGEKMKAVQLKENNKTKKYQENREEGITTNTETAEEVKTCEIQNEVEIEKGPKFGLPDTLEEQNVSEKLGMKSKEAITTNQKVEEPKEAITTSQKVEELKETITTSQKVEELKETITTSQKVEEPKETNKCKKVEESKEANAKGQKIEIPKVSIERSSSPVNSVTTPNVSITDMSSSSENLTRAERRRKLDSIMSRIRQTPSTEKLSSSGSTSNLASMSQTSSSSVLQHMMEQGKLSGMSRAAAIMIKNSKSTEKLNTDSQKDVSNENSAIINREECDGKEASPIQKEPNDLDKDLEMPTNNSNSYLMTKWQHDYGMSSSIDSDADTCTEVST